MLVRGSEREVGKAGQTQREHTQRESRSTRRGTHMAVGTVSHSGQGLRAGARRCRRGWLACGSLRVGRGQARRPRFQGPSRDLPARRETCVGPGAGPVSEDGEGPAFIAAGGARHIPAGPGKLIAIRGGPGAAPEENVTPFKREISQRQNIPQPRQRRTTQKALKNH